MKVFFLGFKRGLILLLCFSLCTISLFSKLIHTQQKEELTEISPVKKVLLFKWTNLNFNYLSMVKNNLQLTIYQVVHITYFISNCSILLFVHTKLAQTIWFLLWAWLTLVTAVRNQFLCCLICLYRFFPLPFFHRWHFLLLRAILKSAFTSTYPIHSNENLFLCFYLTLNIVTQSRSKMQ